MNENSIYIFFIFFAFADDDGDGTLRECSAFMRFFFSRLHG